MKRLDPIIGHKRFNNGFYYRIADDLDLLETRQVQVSGNSRLEFFQTQWPELYTWLMLNISEDNWNLYIRGTYPDVCLILAIFFDDTTLFNEVFSNMLVLTDDRETFL